MTKVTTAAATTYKRVTVGTRLDDSGPPREVDAYSAAVSDGETTGADARTATREWLRSPRGGVAVVAAASGLWTAVMWAAAWMSKLSPFTTSTWGRWDTGNYLSIAEGGYTFESCVGVANRTPDDMCGNAGWFPGYPYAMRFVHLFGVAYDDAGRLLAVAAFVGALLLLWFAVLRHRPPGQALTGMALAAVFPGSIYYGAIFPISFVILSSLAALVLIGRERFWLAGLCGAVATVSYTSGIVIATAAIVPLCTPALGSWRRRVGGALALGGVPTLAYGLVLLNFHRAVGHWDAAFQVQAGYRFTTALPTTTLTDRIRELVTGEGLRWVAMQTAVVLVLVVLTVIVSIRCWPRWGLIERSTVVVSGFWWLLPLFIGGDLSRYRAESLLFPLLIVVSHAGRRTTHVAAALSAVAALVAFQMARSFFDYLII